MGTAFFAAGDEATAAQHNRLAVVGSTAVPGSGTHIWYGRVRYNGATWELVSTHSVAGLTTAKLAWNGGTDELDITLVVIEDFVSRPIVIATPLNTDSAYVVKAGITEAAGVFTAHVAFFDTGNGNRETTETTDMDVNLMIMGQYI